MAEGIHHYRTTHRCKEEEDQNLDIFLPRRAPLLRDDGRAEDVVEVGMEDINGVSGGW